MSSTLETAMALENAADELVYAAARRGFAEIDSWRKELTEAAQKLEVESDVLLEEIKHRHLEVRHYGSGILGSIPEEVREGLGVS